MENNRIFKNCITLEKNVENVKLWNFAMFRLFFYLHQEDWSVISIGMHPSGYRFVFSLMSSWSSTLLTVSVGEKFSPLPRRAITSSGNSLLKRQSYYQNRLLFLHLLQSILSFASFFSCGWLLYFLFLTWSSFTFCKNLHVIDLIFFNCTVIFLLSFSDIFWLS